jgi:hypothetical protein
LDSRTGRTLLANRQRSTLSKGGVRPRDGWGQRMSGKSLVNRTAPIENSTTRPTRACTDWRVGAPWHRPVCTGRPPGIRAYCSGARSRGSVPADGGRLRLVFGRPRDERWRRATALRRERTANRA